MRKLIVQEFMSADGFAAETDGGMRFMQHYPAKPAPRFVQDAQIFVDSINTMVLGATTYSMFASYWPTPAAADDPLAAQLNALDKFVASSSLNEAPWGDYPAATIMPDGIEGVRNLKNKAEDGDIVVWGSLKLSQQLAMAGLVDEFYLRVCSNVIGKGKRLFDEPAELQLVEATRYDDDMLVLRYVPKTA